MAVPDSEYIPPTNEQLANFASVLISGPGFGTMQQRMIKDMLEASPFLRERWLEYHREFQRKADALGKELERAQEDDHLHGL